MPARGEQAMPLRCVVLYGSVRQARQGIRAARFIVGQLAQRGHATTLVDALEQRLPLLDRMYKEYAKGEAPPVLEALAEIYRMADAFVLVSGEYNHGIPPALKNLLDHFLEEYFFRPSAIVCYSAGAFGGVRAAMQLRMTLGELGMPSIPSIFPIPHVQDAFDDRGSAMQPVFEQRVGRFLDELEWYAEALRQRRGERRIEPSQDRASGSTGISTKDGVCSAWWTVLTATRTSAAVSLANIGLPLLVLRAWRGKLLLVTSISIRWPGRKVWWVWPRSIVTRSMRPGLSGRGSPVRSR
jgi:NAD(P)H-dependent FMN reductase